MPSTSISDTARYPRSRRDVAHREVAAHRLLEHGRVGGLPELPLALHAGDDRFDIGLRGALGALDHLEHLEELDLDADPRAQRDAVEHRAVQAHVPVAHLADFAPLRAPGPPGTPSPRRRSDPCGADGRTPRRGSGTSGPCPPWACAGRRCRPGRRWSPAGRLPSSPRGPRAAWAGGGTARARRPPRGWGSTPPRRGSAGRSRRGPARAPRGPTSAPAASSLTGSVHTSSMPARSSSARAWSDLRRMTSFGVFTSPKHTKPAFAIAMAAPRCPRRGLSSYPGIPAAMQRADFRSIPSGIA